MTEHKPHPPLPTRAAMSERYVRTVGDLQALPYGSVLWDPDEEPGGHALFQIDGMAYSESAPWVLWNRHDRWCRFEEVRLPLRILHIPEGTAKHPTEASDD